MCGVCVVGWGGWRAEALCVKSMAHPEANAALGNSSGSIKTISAGLAGTHTHTLMACTHTLPICDARSDAFTSLEDAEELKQFGCWS